jgi:hypothetical protein
VPVERQRWVPVASWAELNAKLRRLVEVLDISARYATLPVSATATLPLTYPQTLVEADTGAGAVTLTLPAPGTVPGFRVDVVKVAGAAALVVDGVTVAARAGWVSTGAAWRQVA